MGRIKDLAGKPQSGVLMFNVIDEANKALKVIEAAPSKHPMRCDQQDLKALSFTDNDIGFFIVLLETAVKGRPAFKVYEGEDRAATELLRKLNLQPLNDKLWIATTGCSWPVAKQRYEETACLGYRAVVFTTPEQLYVLAENPSMFV